MAASRLPRTYWVLWAGMLVNRLGGFVISFLSLYLTQQRGFTPQRAGAIVSLWGAGALVSGPIGGAMADRLGRRATMVLALVLGALAMLHLGAARSPAHIAVAAFLLGMTGDMYRPAVSAAVADLVPPDQRTRAYGYLYWAVNLGFACAAAIAGVLARRSYWLLFAGDAITTLIFAGIVFASVPETRTVRTEHGHFEGLLVPLRDGVFLAFVGLSLLLAIVFFQAFVTLPLDLAAHGISSDQYGGLIAINGVLIVVLQPFALRIVHRFESSQVLAVACLLVGVGYGATQFVHTPAGYAATICIWTLGEIAFSPISPTVIADLSPPALRGTYQGVFQMTWGAAFLVSPLAASSVLQRYGSKALWTCSFLLCVLTAAGNLAVAGARRRRLELLARSGAGDFTASTPGGVA